MIMQKLFFLIYQGKQESQGCWAYQKNGIIIRPLLPFHKNEIFEFVDRIGLPFVEDSAPFWIF